MSAAEIRTSNILFLAALEAEKRGMFSHSEQLLDRAKLLNQKAGGSNNTAYATKLLQFADLCADGGRFEKAEPLYREALSILMQFKGVEHLSTALVMRHLADVCSKRGKESEADELNSQAASILDKLRNCSACENIAVQN